MLERPRLQEQLGMPRHMMHRVGRNFVRRAKGVLGNAGSSTQCRMPKCRRDEHRTLLSQH